MLNHKQLLEQGYTTDDIEAIEDFLDLCKDSPYIGQDICNRTVVAICLQKYGSEIQKPAKLTFAQWHKEDIYAVDECDYPHVIVGGWYDTNYIIRGVVKPKAKGQHFRWLPNGKCHEGTVQVFCENSVDCNELTFPEFDKITEAYRKAINAAAQRRNRKT